MSSAVMGSVRFGNLPPRASVVKPSSPQAFGVILLRVRTKGGIWSRLIKLPPRMPKMSMIADPRLPTWAGVRAIAGYVLDHRGRRVVVVCLVNHARAASAHLLHDALLQWVYSR